MNVPIDQEVSRQGSQETRRKATVALLEGIARASRETGPYVVRDLSWEFTRYLDTQTFPPNPPRDQKALGSSRGANEWR